MEDNPLCDILCLATIFFLEFFGCDARPNGWRHLSWRRRRLLGRLGRRLGRRRLLLLGRRLVHFVISALFFGELFF
jgi:hypothetical protein